MSPTRKPKDPSTLPPQDALAEIEAMTDPLERFVAAPALMDDYRDAISRLAEIRADAARELHQTDSLRGIADRLREQHGVNISAQAIHRIIQPAAKRKAAKTEARARAAAARST